MFEPLLAPLPLLNLGKLRGVSQAGAHEYAFLHTLPAHRGATGDASNAFALSQPAWLAAPQCCPQRQRHSGQTHARPGALEIISR